MCAFTEKQVDYEFNKCNNNDVMKSEYETLPDRSNTQESESNIMYLMSPYNCVMIKNCQRYNHYILITNVYYVECDKQIIVHHKVQYSSLINSYHTNAYNKLREILRPKKVVHSLEKLCIFKP